MNLAGKIIIFLLLSVIAVQAVIYNNKLSNLKPARIPYGLLTINGLYGGDELYLDTHRLTVRSKSNQINENFDSFYKMSEWLNHMTQINFDEFLTWEMESALRGCIVSVLPDNGGVHVQLPVRTRGEYESVYLLATDDNTVFYNDPKKP